MFFENQTGQETYERLKYLDKDVKLHWVLAGKNPVYVRKDIVLVWICHIAHSPSSAGLVPLRL